MRHLGIIDPVSEIAIDGSSGVPEPGLDGFTLSDVNCRKGLREVRGWSW